MKTPPAYYLDYDYDTSYDHPEDEDICRCGTIDSVKVNGWDNNGEGLASYAKSFVGIPAEEPLPPELQEKLKPFVDDFDSSSYEAEVERGYYGEELKDISVPGALTTVLEDYYYAQPNAAGSDNVLTYLRGKGYATAGEKPLEAIKGALQAENGGRVAAKVAKAKKWRKATLTISTIDTPSPSQVLAAGADPRPLESPQPGKQKPVDAIAGVALQKSDGSYELIDGYHRRAWLQSKNKRRANYLVLSHEDYVDPTWYDSRRSQEPTWHNA